MKICTLQPLDLLKFDQVVGFHFLAAIIGEQPIQKQITTSGIKKPLSIGGGLTLHSVKNCIPRREKKAKCSRGSF